MAKSLGKMRSRHGREPGLTHIKDLVPDPANRRAHNPRNIGMVVDALQAVGAARSIVIDEDNVVLAGNGVVEAAAEAGITKVQMVEVDGSTLVAVRRKGLTAEQKRALAIYDNRTGELATWDFEQLQADKDAGLSLQPFWTKEEEAALFKPAAKPGHTDPDHVPDERATDIEAGDLFELGGHRLLCGDATIHGDVLRLLGDDVPSLMVTDPPYGVSIAGGTHDPRDAANYRSGGTVLNDGLVGDALAAFLKLAFTRAVTALAPGSAWYVFHSCIQTAAVLTATEVLGGMRHILVWVKPNFVFARYDYHYRHEPIMYGWTPGAGHQWLGDKTQDSVWEAGITDSDLAKKQHPTAKPVDLFLRPILNHTVDGAPLYEPFAGSGSQLIAAEQTRRRCLGLELEPRYCQVIIDRWEAFTGQKAQKVGEAVRA